MFYVQIITACPTTHIIYVIGFFLFRFVFRLVFRVNGILNRRVLFVYEINVLLPTTSYEHRVISCGINSGVVWCGLSVRSDNCSDTTAFYRGPFVLFSVRFLCVFYVCLLRVSVPREQPKAAAVVSNTGARAGLSARVRRLAVGRATNNIRANR